jgi:Ca-activated chloride channel family protein
MCFAWPENIGYLLLLMPLAVILGYGVMRQLQAREAVVGPAVARLMMRGVSKRVLVVKKVLLFCGMALLLFAMAGPRLCSGGRPVLRKGADIVFVLDVSRSMQARDGLPDRLGQAKQEITSISHAITGGRRAILLFAASPLVQCPLTTDKEAFDALLGMASPDLIEEQGTSFRSAIELAGRLLEPESERRLASGVNGEKIMVLLSDGEDHAGRVQSAVQQLKKGGIHLFVIGVGMNQPVEIPMAETGQGVKRDESGKVVMSRFRPEALQMLARDAAGFYFRSRPDRPVYRDVADRINRIAAASRWVMEPDEREPLYPYFLAAGIVFLFAETMTGRDRGTRL